MAAFIPNYAKFARPLATDPRPAGLVLPAEPTLEVRTLPAGTSLADRAAALAGALVFPLPADYTSGRCGAWFWTVMEFAFPGVASTITGSLAMFPITVTEVDAAHFARLTAGTGAGDSDIFPGMIGDAASRSGNFNLDEAVGALSILIFSLGKTPTPQNITAFTDSRPRAIAGRSGFSPTAQSPMAPSRLPSLTTMKRVGGYFNDRPALRVQLIQHLANWTVDAVDPLRTIVGAQVKLWKMGGMEHANQVASLLANYGPVVERIQGLQASIYRFDQLYDEYQASQDQYKAYDGVIHGDRRRFFHLKEYDDLALLATSVARLSIRTLGNYRQGQVSPYLGIFKQICQDNGIPLPELAAGVGAGPGPTLLPGQPGIPAGTGGVAPGGTGGGTGRGTGPAPPGPTQATGSG